MNPLILNLLLTIGLELPVVLFFLKKEKTIPLILFVILVNGFSLPLATWAYHTLGCSYGLVEGLVAIGETGLYWMYLRSGNRETDLKLPVIATFLANFLSMSSGWILQYFGLL